MDLRDKDGVSISNYTKIQNENFVLIQVQMGPFSKPEIAPVIAGEPVQMEKLEGLTDQGKFNKAEYDRLREKFEGSLGVDLSRVRIHTDSTSEAAAAAVLRGHAGLSHPPSLLSVPARVVVVTGSPGVGKTTAVSAAVAELRGSGFEVAGFVQPGLWQDGDKVGFLITDLGSGDEVEFARRVGRSSGQPPASHDGTMR